ncbi:MAG: hypothetical protein NTZ48_00480, partial [Candidatus Omnitrophica bacterium]|nr:hypothetical protein [Candidatus Omnitrophota bacterium]
GLKFECGCEKLCLMCLVLFHVGSIIAHNVVDNSLWAAALLFMSRKFVIAALFSFFCLVGIVREIIVWRLYLKTRNPVLRKIAFWCWLPQIGSLIPLLYMGGTFKLVLHWVVGDFLGKIVNLLKRITKTKSFLLLSFALATYSGFMLLTGCVPNSGAVPATLAIHPAILVCVVIAAVVIDRILDKYRTIDSKNMQGLCANEAYSKDTYFQAYQKSFKDGEYNVKEPVYTPFGQTIRSYFSGGVQLDSMSPPGKGITYASATGAVVFNKHNLALRVLGFAGGMAVFQDEEKSKSEDMQLVPIINDLALAIARNKVTPEEIRRWQTQIRNLAQKILKAQLDAKDKERAQVTLDEEDRKIPGIENFASLLGMMGMGGGTPAPGKGDFKEDGGRTGAVGASGADSGADIGRAGTNSLVWRLANPGEVWLIKKELIRRAALDPRGTINPLVGALINPGIIGAAKELLLEISASHPRDTANPLAVALMHQGRRDAAKELLLKISVHHPRETANPLVSALADPQRIDVAKELLLKISVDHPSDTINPLVGSLATPGIRDASKELLLQISVSYPWKTVNSLFGALANPQRTDPAKELLIHIYRGLTSPKVKKDIRSFMDKIQKRDRNPLVQEALSDIRAQLNLPPPTAAPDAVPPATAGGSNLQEPVLVAFQTKPAAAPDPAAPTATGSSPEFGEMNATVVKTDGIIQDENQRFPDRQEPGRYGKDFKQ